MSGPRTLHVRTVADPAAMAAAVREQARGLDPSLPIRISLFGDLVNENLVQERLIATLSSFFGALALLLTSLGLYGIIAYSVQRRTREIGIRMSLGANRAAILVGILRESFVVVAAGVAVGAGASVFVSRLVARQLFGISPGDPTTVGAAILFLFAVAAVAAYIPARRATLVDPAIALRN